MGLIKNLTAAIERLATVIDEGNSRPDPAVELSRQLIEQLKTAAGICPTCRGGGSVGEYRQVESVQVVVKVQCPVCEGSGRVKVRNTEEEQ